MATEGFRQSVSPKTAAWSSTYRNIPNWVCLLAQSVFVAVLVNGGAMILSGQLLLIALIGSFFGMPWLARWLIWILPDRLLNRRIYGQLKTKGWPNLRLDAKFTGFCPRAWLRIPAYADVQVIPWNSAVINLNDPNPFPKDSPEGVLWAVLHILDEQDAEGNSEPQ